MTDHDTPTAARTSVGRRVRRRVRRLLASIRTRTVAAVVAVLAIALVGTALGTRTVLLAQVDGRIDDQLRQEVEELRLFAEQGLDPATGEPFGDDAERLLTVFVDRSVPVRGEVILAYVDGELVARTLQETPYRVDTDPELEASWADLDTSVRGEVETPAGRFAYLGVPISSEAGADAVLLVGTFRQVVAAEVDQTVTVTTLVAFVALLLGVAVAIGLSRRILQPLASMSRAASGLGESDLSRRLGRTGADDELDDLAATFDAMLDRLEAAFEDQRRFLDDAGHELRTPITVVRGHLETLGEEPSAEDLDDTKRLVLDELDRMRRIVDDLLMLAQQDRPDFVVPAPFELDELTTSVLRRASALSEAHSWRLDHVGIGVVVGDEQRLAQALLQLADNAARHTPPGSTVEVGSSVERGLVRLWVADDGPGIPADAADQVFERFGRVPGRSSRTEGAGLGLAIVAAVAEGHRGEAVLRPSATGGAHFELRVPQPTGPAVGDGDRDTTAAADDLAVAAVEASAPRRQTWPAS